MRILQVRFKNLNSLVGEWAIDLAHPAFVSDGIFAITGPTGAGKTTILDAICLALYGRTPRLNKVTKSGNEIMSRHTGECFAEVAFETQRGQYRCHWHQHRARRKPDGELQPPRHEISDADSGEVFEAKIRGVADQIEAATGMDFDRFTRSMLLAQGGFDTFLKAEADRRAPILEQITGTEIYSRISIRVHERRAEERKKLDGLLAELAGMQLLTPEEEQQLGKSLEQKRREDVKLNQQIVQQNQAITWLEGIDRLEKELVQLDQQNNDLKSRMEAFAPDQEKLEAATRALELAADYATLKSIRQDQDKEQRSLGTNQEALPGCEKAVKIADEAVKKAEGQLANRKSEQEKSLPIIRRVRELDLKITEKDTPIEEAVDAIAESKNNIAKQQKKQEEDLSELGKKRKTFGNVVKELEATKADEGLVENLAGIRERFEALRAVGAQVDGKLRETEQAEQAFEETSGLWKKKSKRLNAETKKRDEIQRKLADKRAVLADTLEHKELGDWRSRLVELGDRKDFLGKTAEANQVILSSQKALEELARGKETLEKKQSGLNRQLNEQTAKKVAIEKERDLLVNQLTLLKKIESYEKARQQLEDGKACPLCGATAHPFAEGNIPVPDETSQRLETAKEELNAATDAVAELRVNLEGVRNELEHVATGQKEHAATIEKTRPVVLHACEDLGLDASASDLDVKLKALQDENLRSYEHAKEVVKAAEKHERTINTLRESLDAANAAVSNAERETQDAAHAKGSAEKSANLLKKEADGLRGTQEASLAALQKDVQGYGIDAMTFDNLDQVQSRLTTRRDQWMGRQQKKAELDRQIAALDMQTRHQAAQIQRSENELKKQQKHHDDLLRDRKSLAAERREMYGDKDPDKEEARLSGAIETADRELNTVREKLNQANQALSQLRTKIRELTESIAVRANQLKSSEEAFLARFEELGFPSEGRYQAACLPESERKALAQRSKELSDEKTKIESAWKKNTELLKEERKKQITNEQLDKLKSDLEALVAKQKTLQQEIGIIRGKLEGNEDLKKKQQARALAIDSQKRECSRWDLLHELIGSADGKKYRNFAQGLTFEMMIGHANRQLQKMTDRYLLVRDDAQPLELNVIDSYQAGEIRSTKNLSGGESFIVSLALALGLSHMASKNVRVDSLFLDEGFGSLDEEALDTALETLGSLQHEGKLIGVISHVAAIKERISTQIQVVPDTGGRSVIFGPGCRL